jgi:hypothetical protein
MLPPLLLRLGPPFAALNASLEPMPSSGTPRNGATCDALAAAAAFAAAVFAASAVVAATTAMAAVVRAAAEPGRESGGAAKNLCSGKCTGT